MSHVTAAQMEFRNFFERNTSTRNFAFQASPQTGVALPRCRRCDGLEDLGAITSWKAKQDYLQDLGILILFNLRGVKQRPYDAA